MIPKIIHYCWFGGNDLTDEVKKYIATWRKYCPDYKIIEWNESNFDINENDYVREAYEAKKWAFVTDYVRLKVIYENGGIYMDTDVEVVKSLDDLLIYDAVSGYESKTSIQTGTMAACRGNSWIKMLLDDYENRHFVKQDGSLDTKTNVQVITKLTVAKYGLELDGMTKTFGENMILLPFDYLCAKSYKTGEITKTVNTYTVHNFTGSWLSKQEKDLQKVRRKYYNNLIFLPDCRIKNKVAILLATMKLEGMGGVFRLIKKKLC